MSNIWNGDASRRDFLKLAAAAGAAGTGALSLDAAAQAGQPINFYTWSAAVDLVKSHLTAFESSTGLKVNYNNAPWAQYRDTMVTKFVGSAPIDPPPCTSIFGGIPRVALTATFGNRK